MKKIYLILTHTGTTLSTIIKCYTKDEFSHVSIALDKELNTMYSFGRLRPSNPFIGGFVHEGIDFGTFKRFKNTQSEIYSLEIADNKYEKIKEDRLLKINENIAYESAEKEVIKKEKLKDIANFINNFKEPDKTYFYLKYFINMESKEIAKKYNTTLSSVENRLYRCRLALKKFIDGGV